MQLVVVFNLESVEKSNISRTKNPFYMKEKTFFIVFEELSFGENIKIGDTSY